MGFPLFSQYVLFLPRDFGLESEELNWKVEVGGGKEKLEVWNQRENVGRLDLNSRLGSGRVLSRRIC